MLIKIFICFFLLVNTLYSYQKTTVVVTLEPYKYLVEKIGKGKVRVKSLYKNSKIINNHSQFELRKHSKSTVYMTSQLNNENNFIDIFKKYNKNIRIVDISLNIKRLPLTSKKNNPYIWLDPLNLISISHNILKELIRIDKRNEKYYVNNYISLIEEIDSLFIRIRKLYDASEKDNAYVFEPKWDYFARRYNFSVFLIKEEIIKAHELSKFSAFTKENYIAKTLTAPNIDYDVLRSVANTSDTTIIEHDIYKYGVLANIYNLGFILFTKNKIK